MTISTLRAPLWSILALSVAAVSASCVPVSSARPDLSRVLSTQTEADLIRATERERLRALVEANMEVALRLHADDFQLINPFGGSLSKDQYLGGVASGEIDYLIWEPDTIDVRLYGLAAAIRYRSQLEIVFRGQTISRRRYWHTDLYEKRGTRWEVVWSHATEIR